ncbi:type II toxin-antitoxin system prevent-host-death family antitoxin [Brevundimonas sp.]|uniref:type II toxin-antitoxin system Phd/YefM family antitoxin n=1 Tax=Brevundimonas sp. TaxID=1871086 RepID=UPI002ABAFA10|nr:type II toxin-antitoxin system prevent-host-death family antitoxin [Brevundimonas sp.]MDZ4363930.1 type II toxin-antitoxin system prevent-host-death family antitoxin [Brevundimonas sp.]
MERTITATDANREFSRVFNEVANGETYVVTARGKPLVRIAKLESPVADEAARRAKVHALVDELGNLPLRAPGRIIREDGYE